VNYTDLEISDDVIAAVDAGRKIEAIKILRAETGLGLAEAKDVVDQLAQQRDGVSGSGPVPMQEVGGAASMIKMVVLIAVILVVYFYYFAS
jgi:CHASE3 domain sensor protein